MINEILNVTAEDNNGNLIHINEAEKGIKYHCPLCKKEFILRKSGKIGKGSRRPHFAHNELTPNCTPEGVLHYSFKMLLFNILAKYKAENKPFIINWSCDSCKQNNIADILEKTYSIKLEYILGEFRPDIALIDKDDKTIAVIELVDSHKPEEKAIEYYKTNNIILIQINLTSDLDLVCVENKAKKPDIVDLCLNLNCQNHYKYKLIRQIGVQTCRCNRCFHPLQKYSIIINSVIGRHLSNEFTDDEINIVKTLAKENELDISIIKDKNGKRPINSCLNCKIIQSKYRRRPL